MPFEALIGTGRKVNIGIIGLGIMGEQYIGVYRSHPHTEVLAVASRTPEKAIAIAAKYGIPHPCADWREMLQIDEIDAVCVATPDDLHYEPARASMEAGKHVLIEKPMTTNVREADSLVRVARETGKKVQVAFNHRWLSAYHEGHAAIERGAIGQPLAAFARKNDPIYVPTEYINWASQTTPAWFLSCHDIDLVRWYLGSEPVEARAWGVKRVLRAKGIDTYDMIQAQVRFENGAIAAFESGWIYPNTFPTMVDSFVEVVGENGHLHFDRKSESIELSTPDKFSYPRTFLGSRVFGTLRGAFPSCLSDFVRSIREDLKPEVGVMDGRQVTAVLCAIHQSLETGDTVAIM